jgi:hypothetical protein
MRLTLHDEAAASTRLELPARRLWPIGLVVAVFFAVFAAIDWMQIAKISSHSVRGVSDRSPYCSCVTESRPGSGMAD